LCEGKSVYESCFFEGIIDVKPCRSERNGLKYITKDDQTYINCRV